MKKQCTRCSNWYPADTEHFYVDKRRKDGLSSHCHGCISQQKAMYYEANRDAILRQKAENYATNRGKHHQRDPEAKRKYDCEYQAKRLKNPQYKLGHSISSAMGRSLKGSKDGRQWESLVGYGLNALITHLESQFTKGMTWDNYGEWHIDHIRPISDFNFTSPDDPEFRECWSLWNLQPMWAEDNLRKHAKCENPPLPLRVGGGALGDS